MVPPPKHLWLQHSDDWKGGENAPHFLAKAKALKLSPELRPLRKISVAEAAELNGISEATFRRRYRHLMKRISPRRLVVALSDALNLNTGEK